MLYKLSWLCSILQNDADDAISLDDVEADEDIKVEEVNVKSTKRPMKQGGKGSTKKAKVEAMENNLLQRAIDTMSKSEKSTADSFDKFADYVASELRAITSKQLQGWAKLQIQTTLYNWQMQSSGQQSPTVLATPNIAINPYSQRFPLNTAHPTTSSINSLLPRCHIHQLQALVSINWQILYSFAHI